MGKSLKSNVKHQLWMPSRAANMPSAVVASLHTMPSKHRCSHLYLLLRRKKPLQWSPKWQYRMICADKEEKWSKPEAKTLPSGVFFLQSSLHKLKFSYNCNIPSVCQHVAELICRFIIKMAAQSYTCVFNPAAPAMRNTPCYKNQEVHGQPTCHKHCVAQHRLWCENLHQTQARQAMKTCAPPKKKKNKANEIQLSIKCACTCQSLPHRTASSFLN